MANVNVRIDPEIKKEAEQIFALLGLTPTTAITLFYNQVIRTCSIPFELKADIPNEETMEAIREAKHLEEHPEEARGFASADDLISDILK